MFLRAHYPLPGGRRTYGLPGMGLGEMPLSEKSYSSASVPCWKRNTGRAAWLGEEHMETDVFERSIREDVEREKEHACLLLKLSEQEGRNFPEHGRRSQCRVLTDANLSRIRIIMRWMVMRKLLIFV